MKKVTHILGQIWWCIFSWREKYPTWENITKEVAQTLRKGDSVVVVTQEIGLCEEQQPGRGNYTMANQLVRFQQNFPEVPILAQVSVAISAKRQGVRITRTIGPSTEDTPYDRSTMEYNSLTVAEVQIAWMKEHGKFPSDMVIVLTSPDHLGRVIRIMQKLGISNMIPLPLPTLKQKDYMDSTSLYASIRIGAKIPFGENLYRFRELISRFLFLWKGWI